MSSDSDTLIDEICSPLYRFPVTRIQVVFAAKKQFHLSGSEPAIRGQIGYHLKRICCAFPDYRNRECHQCRLAGSCFYITLFSPPAGRSANTLTQSSGIRRFVFSLHGSQILAPEESAKCLFTLFGPDIHYRFFLEAVTAAFSSLDLEIFAMEPQIPANDAADDLSHPLAAWLHPLESERKEIMLFFQTPVRFVKSGKKVKGDVNFLLIVQAAIRRLRDLKRAFGQDQAMGETNDRFFNLVNSVQVLENNLLWSARNRYSYSQNRDVFLSGFTGKMLLDAAAGRFYRFLKAGELVHIGKGTSNGNGKIRVMTGED